MSKALRVLGYVRVSSEEQAAGTSLADQERSIRACAKARGVKVASVYTEREGGGYDKNELREQQNSLIRDVRAGDLVVCDKLDRWSRDTEYTLRTVRQIREKGASFYAVADQCDPDSRDGEMMLTMRAMFAREEHKRIKERMVGTRRLLRDRGLYSEGTCPLGYRRTHGKGGKLDGKNVLVIVPEEAKIVRKIFRSYVGGRSMTKIADDLGLKLDRVKDALHRRIYTGEIQNGKGEWMPETHEAIIDADLYTRAQATIERRRTTRTPHSDGVAETSTWILRNLARCGLCGAKMSAAYAGPHGEGRRHYYRCFAKCSSKGPRKRNDAYIPVRAVEEAFGVLVLERFLSIKSELAKGTDAPKPPPPVDHTERREKLKRRRARYLEAFADENMTRDELRAAMAKLDAESMKLDAAEQVSRKPTMSVADAKRLLLANGAFEKGWSKAPPDNRRRICELLASAVAIEKGKAPRPTWRSVDEMADIVAKKAG